LRYDDSSIESSQGYDSFGLVDSVTHFNKAFYLLLEVSLQEGD